MSAASAVGAVGLVVARPARMLGIEPFFMELIAGMEERLATTEIPLVLHMVPDQDAEIAAYRRWVERRVVDAVVVVNLLADDRRPQVLTELGLPALLLGSWQGPPPLPAVRTDEAEPVRTAIEYLSGLGHRRLARVTGPSALLHTQARTAALKEACDASGLAPVVVEADYSEESGALATRQLLEGAERPTAILYDNDVMATGGLRVAQDAGIRVPHELSLLGWDDSALCQMAGLTTMSTDVHEWGMLVAESVAELLGGGPVTERWRPPAHLVVRSTTAPAAGPHSLPAG